MGNNLPPMDSHHWRDAPWNDNGPEPDGCCRHCDSWFMASGLRVRAVDLDDLRTVVHTVCPECDNVIKATMSDISEQYYEAWRRTPDEMEITIDNYSELREL